MSNNINVAFKVSGGELSSFIDSIQKKSDQLTNSAIKTAIEQTTKGKENIRIIEEQIKAVERKNRIEGQAIRSIGMEKRENELKENRSYYENQKGQVDKNRNLSIGQKSTQLEAL